MFRLLTNKMDVYSVQNNAQEILFAVDGLEKITIPDDFVLTNMEGMPILFTGLETRFVLNDVVIPVNFSTCLFYQGRINNEKEGRLVKFMDGSKFSEDTKVTDYLKFNKGDVLDEKAIKKVLAAKNIKYIEEPSLTKKNGHIDTKPLGQEIWFARDNLVMNEALASVRNKNIIIYPEVNGKLKLVWHHGSSGIVVYELRIIGLIQLEDKIVLRTLPEYHDSKAIVTAMEQGLANNVTTYEPLMFTKAWITKLENEGYNVYKASGIPEIITKASDLNSSIWKR